MSEFTDEIIKNWAKEVNNSFEQIVSLTKRLMDEYQKNTIIISDIIKKNILKQAIDLQSNIDKLIQTKTISTDITYEDLDAIYRLAEESRLGLEGENFVINAFEYLKKNGYCYMTLNCDALDKDNVLYGTVNEDETKITIGFSINELEKTLCHDNLYWNIEKVNKPYSDIYNCRINMKVPGLDSLLNPENNKENQKLKIYTKDENH